MAFDNLSAPQPVAARPAGRSTRRPSVVNELFRRFAEKASDIFGSTWAFAVSVFIVVVWGFLGRFFHYSDTWQLVINTATSVMAFLMVFLIQNTQNRHAQAIQLKLDELIRSTQGARNDLVNLEDLSEDALQRLRDEFRAMAEAERAALGADRRE